MTIKQALALIKSDNESGVFEALSHDFPVEARAVEDALLSYTTAIQSGRGNVNDYIQPIIETAMNWLTVTMPMRKKVQS